MTELVRQLTANSSMKDMIPVRQTKKVKRSDAEETRERALEEIDRIMVESDDEEFQEDIQAPPEILTTQAKLDGEPDSPPTKKARKVKNRDTEVVDYLKEKSQVCNFSITLCIQFI